MPSTASAITYAQAKQAHNHTTTLNRAKGEENAINREVASVDALGSVIKWEAESAN
jgi:hypothetical protein